MKFLRKLFLFYALIIIAFVNALHSFNNEATLNINAKNQKMLRKSSSKSDSINSEPNIPSANPADGSNQNKDNVPAVPAQGAVTDNGVAMSYKNAVYSDLVINPDRPSCPQSEDPRMGRKTKEEEPMLGYYPAQGPMKKPNPYKILDSQEFAHIHYLFDYLDTFFIKKNNMSFLDYMTSEFEKIYNEAKKIAKIDKRFADPYTLEKLIFYFSNGAAGTQPFTDPRLISPKASEVKVITPSKEDNVSLMKTLSSFNKDLANKDYTDMISPVQLLLILEGWQWGGASGSQDIIDAKKILDKYDFNGDGALDREELILFSILHNLKHFKQCKDFCYKNIIDQVIDPLFMYLDCDNDGYVNSENIWQGLMNIYRQDKNYDLYKCKLPLELNKFYRTNSVNDFVLKYSSLADGFLNLEEFRKGLLLGYWERQVKANVFYKKSEINNKDKRWAEAGVKDVECEQIKSFFPKK